jgi:uncharacterized membrane protein
MDDVEIPYRVLKLLHVFGAILFVGNMLVTALWKAMADRTREPKIVVFAQRLVTVTDFVFTGFGAGLVLASGLLMARVFGEEFWKLYWIAWGLGLFVASGLIWVAILVPIQVKQSQLAREFADGSPVPEAYWRLGRLWMAFGTLATALPVANLYFMVLRPE